MVTIQLTHEEWFIIQSIYERVCKQTRKNLHKKKWIKQEEGLMLNLETGVCYDARAHKFVIDQAPDLRALADQMSITPLLASDQDDTRPTGALTMNEEPPAESGS